MKWLLSIVSILFVFVLLGVMALGINPFQIIEIKMKGTCPSIESGEFKHINFLGQELRLPSKLITSCYAHYFESGWDIDPARIVLDAELPNFSPLEGIEWPDVYKSDDQIRISVTGIELNPEDVKTIDPNEVTKALKRDVSRKNRQGEPIYTKSEVPYHGLVKYNSDKTIPIYSGDIYASLDDSGNVNFYLDCVEDKKKHHRHWNCRSSSRSIYPGITYHYYYNLEHLADAEKINQQVSEFLKRPQPSSY